MINKKRLGIAHIKTVINWWLNGYIFCLLYAPNVPYNLLLNYFYCPALQAQLLCNNVQTVKISYVAPPIGHFVKLQSAAQKGCQWWKRPLEEQHKKQVFLMLQLKSYSNFVTFWHGNGPYAEPKNFPQGAGKAPRRSQHVGHYTRVKLYYTIKKSVGKGEIQGALYTEQFTTGSKGLFNLVLVSFPR